MVNRPTIFLFKPNKLNIYITPQLLRSNLDCDITLIKEFVSLTKKACAQEWSQEQQWSRSTCAPSASTPFEVLSPYRPNRAWDPVPPPTFALQFIAAGNMIKRTESQTTEAYDLKETKWLFGASHPV